MYNFLDLLVKNQILGEMLIRRVNVREGKIILHFFQKLWYLDLDLKILLQILL